MRPIFNPVIMVQDNFKPNGSIGLHYASQHHMDKMIKILVGGLFLFLENQAINHPFLCFQLRHFHLCSPFCLDSHWNCKWSSLTRQRFGPEVSRRCRLPGQIDASQTTMQVHVSSFSCRQWVFNVVSSISHRDPTKPVGRHLHPRVLRDINFTRGWVGEFWPPTCFQS